MSNGKKIAIYVGTALAWGATAFTYVLPGLGIAHASPDEVMPFVGAFGLLALVLTALSAKTASQS